MKNQGYEKSQIPKKFYVYGKITKFNVIYKIKDKLQNLTNFLIETKFLIML